MAKPISEKIADALEAARRVTVENIVDASRLKRPDITLLKREGFLKTIIKGWYLLDADLSAPNTGESVLWQESYWAFIGHYLNSRLNEHYILSAEQSLDIHTGVNLMPTQLLIGNSLKKNQVIKLPKDLSLSLFSASDLPAEADVYQGVNIYPLPDSLEKVGPLYFQKQPQEIVLALQLVVPSELLRVLLGTGNAAASGRIAGAYRHLGMNDEADTVAAAMRQAGHSIKEVDPFERPLPLVDNIRPQSPHASRIALHWQQLSEQISPLLDAPIRPPADIEAALIALEETYTHDAYNSLSIEGYKVTEALVDKVRSGDWNPDDNPQDQQQLDTMAARGYFEAHNLVKDAIRKLHEQSLPLRKLEHTTGEWYRALFAPMVRANMFDAADLAGYRTRPVFIRGSRHTPLPREALMDAMGTLFECLSKEPHPLVRAILGHWLIGYIHPYPDGNGRTARFLMNALLVSSGYPWTIIRLEQRDDYMQALEALSTQQNPVPFVTLIQASMRYQW